MLRRPPHVALRAVVVVVAVVAVAALQQLEARTMTAPAVAVLAIDRSGYG
jgi:hypothetical protein